MQQLRLRALVAATAMLAGSQASAALYDWTAEHISTTDTTDNLITGDFGSGTISAPWRDITKFWFASDATTAYFRIDLADGPGTTNPNALESIIYSVYIDADSDTSTGGLGSDWSYLYWDGSRVAGIDNIIDTHYSNLGSISDQHVHSYTGTGAFGFTFGGYADFGVVDDINDTAHTIEWSAPLSTFGLADLNGAMIYGASYDISSPTESFDLARITVPAVAPVPATWLFLVPGLVGLRLVQRRAMRR